MLPQEALALPAAVLLDLVAVIEQEVHQVGIRRAPQAALHTAHHQLPGSAQGGPHPTLSQCQTSTVLRPRATAILPNAASLCVCMTNVKRMTSPPVCSHPYRLV